MNERSAWDSGSLEFEQVSSPEPDGRYAMTSHRCSFSQCAGPGAAQGTPGPAQQGTPAQRGARPVPGPARAAPGQSPAAGSAPGVDATFAAFRTSLGYRQVNR
jgi:hypothetical protein